MRCQCKSLGKQIDTIGEPLGTGGEASVYRVDGHPELVAKIYHPNRQTPERADKLQHMLANPPCDSLYEATRGRGTPTFSIAWPQHRLTVPGLRNMETVVGYLMPAIDIGGHHGAESILSFYNPRLRARKGLRVPDLYLYMIAYNLAVVISELHQKNYVIGDINQSNFLARQNAYVTIIDTDSFQVPTPGGQAFAATVLTPGFTAPELLSGAATGLRTVEQDNFALAVLIFKLLMQGWHPYTASSPNQQNAAEQEENQLVLMGQFPYGKKKPRGVRAPQKAPDFEQLLPPPLQEMFIACFVAGHKQPQKRPRAHEWSQQLQKMVALDHEATARLNRPTLSGQSLMRECGRNPEHMVSQHLPAGSCAQCDGQAQRTRPPPAPPVLQVQLPIPSGASPVYIPPSPLGVSVAPVQSAPLPSVSTGNRYQYSRPQPPPVPISLPPLVKRSGTLGRLLVVSGIVAAGLAGYLYLQISEPSSRPQPLNPSVVGASMAGAQPVEPPEWLKKQQRPAAGMATGAAPDLAAPKLPDLAPLDPDEPIVSIGPRADAAAAAQKPADPDEPLVGGGQPPNASSATGQEAPDLRPQPAKSILDKDLFE